MCGIAGYIGTQELGPRVIENCLAVMRRRGPDDRAARHWINPQGRHVHLLFTRLSIIKTVIFLIAGKLDFNAINPHAGQPT